MCDASPPAAREASRFVIRGALQGVGYRFHVRAAAVGCGVAGWIRNGSAGGIEVHAEGTHDALAAFRAMLAEPSTYGRALHYEETRVPCEGFDSFVVRH